MSQTKDTQLKTVNYFCCKVSQRGAIIEPDFVVFVANASEIREWAGIRRVGQDRLGAQRFLKESRTRAIQNFFKKDSGNIIPVSIILAFEKGRATFVPSENPTVKAQASHTSWGNLRFTYEDGMSETQRPALIVDGQHRLFAMADMEEDLPMPVIALLDASPVDQAFQFVVINSKASRVKTHNTKNIIAEFNEDELIEKLSKVGINYGNYPAILKQLDTEEDGPFYQLLDWSNGKKDKNKISVDLTTIENCLKFIKRHVPDLLSDEEEEARIEVFRTIWNTVSSNYEFLWKNNDMLMSKVGMQALNEVIVERFSRAYDDEDIDIFDQDDLEAYISTKVLKKIPEEYWTRDRAIKLQDNSVVKKAIKGDLDKLLSKRRKNNLPWDYELEVIVSSEDITD